MVETLRNRNGNSSSSTSTTTQQPGLERLDSRQNSLVEDLGMERIRARLEETQTKILQDVDKKLTSMIEETLDEVRKGTITSQIRRLFSDDKTTHDGGGGGGDKRKPSQNGTLHDKEFIKRNSLLTDLLEVKHIRAIYNIHIVAVIIMFLNCLTHDFVDSGRINLGLNPVIKGFHGFKRAILIWASMQSIALLIYPVFKYWIALRRVTPKTLQKPFGYLSTLVLLSFIISFGYSATFAIKTLDLGLASVIGLFLEMTRFLMKMYAFIRTNASKGQLASFGHYVYFLFCPTLVYRESYPRNRQIRWKFVLQCYAEVLGVILYMSFMFERYVIPVFQKVGASQINSSEFVIQLFGCMMPAVLIFLSGFYLLLHAWMNASAELLRFADRQFYLDWWNATSFAEYYRKWNVVVHDWLYAYVYKDVYENVFKGNRTAAMLMVFLISSVVHEYILAFTFGFFYPIMLVLFLGVGVLVMILTKKTKSSLGNIFMWFGIITGNAMMLALYNMEYMARRNCPVGDSISDYFIPVSWSCNGILTKPDWKVTF